MGGGDEAVAHGIYIGDEYPFKKISIDRQLLRASKLKIGPGHPLKSRS